MLRETCLLLENTNYFVLREFKSFSAQRKNNKMLTSKLEVLVNFGPKPDEKLINRTLEDLKSRDGVKDAEFKNGAFVVETILPNQIVLDAVSQTTGKKTVLQGFGETLSAAAMVSSCDSGPVGVIRFQQSGGALVADGTIDGLPPGRHGLHVTEHGDISQGCAALTGHYNPTNSVHGAPEDTHERHAGDLGNIEADSTGRASFRIVDSVLQIPEIIGRCIAITEHPDDLGRGQGPNSKVNGNSGKPIACGIIARSAGIFANPKRICECDGVVVWDERERPLAGKGRRDARTTVVSETENGGGDAGVKSCCRH